MKRILTEVSQQKNQKTLILVGSTGFQEKSEGGEFSKYWHSLSRIPAKQSSLQSASTVQSLYAHRSGETNE